MSIIDKLSFVCLFVLVCVFSMVEELRIENKRIKGIGIGAPEGPISLDDFRSLQRSNTVS